MRELRTFNLIYIVARHAERAVGDVIVDSIESPPGEAGPA